MKLGKLSFILSIALLNSFNYGATETTTNDIELDRPCAHIHNLDGSAVTYRELALWAVNSAVYRSRELGDSVSSVTPLIKVLSNSPSASVTSSEFFTINTDIIPLVEEIILDRFNKGTVIDTKYGSNIDATA